MTEFEAATIAYQNTSLAILEQQGQVMTQAFTQQGEALRVIIERTGN